MEQNLFGAEEVAVVEQAPVFSKSDVDCFEQDGTIWFCANDVAKAIDYDATHINHWNRWLNSTDKLTAQNRRSGQARAMTYISEGALHMVLIKTNVPKAEPFRQWVTHEVIPSIRKTDGSKLQLLEPVKQNIVVKENKPITFSLSDVDVLEENGWLWFCLSDVGKVLEITNTRQWKDWFDEDEIIAYKKHTELSAGNPNKTYIKETALYRILNRSNSPKAKPFERWITKEVIPTLRKTGSYSVQQKSEDKISDKEIECKLQQNRMGIYDRLHALAQEYSGDYKQILDAYATKELTGEMLLPLPKLDKKTYSATELSEYINNKYGVKLSANKIGHIAKSNNLQDRNKVNGEWFRDKSRYSSKEVETFRYYESAADEIYSLYMKESA